MLDTCKAQALRNAIASDELLVHLHANATEKHLRNPNAAFDVSLDEAKRVYVLGRPSSV